MGAYIKRRICLLMAFIMIAGSLPVTAQDSDYALSCPPTLSEDEIYDLPEFLVASPSAFDTMMVEPFSETESISWTVNPVDADVNVTRVSGNHILELNLTPEEKDMLGDISSATLVIGVSPAFGARRLAVWSDLTGRDEDGSVAENVNNITFLSSANLGVANRIVRTSGLSGATSATLTIPTSMLTNGADTASKIYIATTTDSNLNPPDHPTSPGNPEALTLAANHRGGGTSNEFNNFQSVVLNVVEGLPTIGTIFDLQAHIAGMPTGTFANTTHLISSHTGGTPENVVLGIATGGSPAPPAGITRYLTVNRQQANRTRGLLLRGIPLEAGDTITVHGRLVTTTTGLRMAFQEEAVTGNMQSLPIGHGEFTMTYTVSPGLAESSNQNIRIIAHGEAGTADVAALFRVYNITVYREDRSADIVRVQNPAMGGVFEVVSPYSTVNWNTWHQFRAAHHTHTIRSDGAASHRDMLVDHYNRGFSIVASTDHNVIENGDWTTHPPEPTVNHWTPRQWDHASNLMTTAEQDLINAGTWTVGSGRALPTGSRFSALGFMRPQMRGILGLPGTPTGTNAGMISVPNSNEQTIRDHVLTYWLNHNSSNASSSVDTEVVITNLLTQVQNSTNGMAVFAHPGRHTCGRATRCSMHSNSGNRCEHSGAAGNIAASNLPREVNRYVTRFNNFSRAIGMEIYNRPDHESRSDRILWDNILMEIMPQRERNVWGFANDDSHSMDGTGLGWNVMLMPSLTDGNHRTAMRDGTFYMVSRIDRRLGVNAGQGTGAAGGWHEPLMNRQAPAITNISVTGQTITITGVNYDEILWITGNPFRAGFPGTPADVTQGGGVVIHAEEFNAAGNSLNLAQTGRYVWGNYVRAVLVCRTGHGSRINSHGVALTQPFGVYRLNCTTCSNSGNCCNACGNVCVGGCTSTPCQFLANPIRHMSAAQVVSGIGAGWNLGNRFDARGHETQWVNPATTQANIRAIKAGGFNAIRIPVTWTSIGTGSPANAQAAATWTIPPAWMNRVRDVVRWAYDEDMYVILNIHHENFIYDNLTANTDLAEQILVNLWTQICAAFNNQFGYRLIFAGLNEPRIIGTQANPRPDEWRGGTPAERIAINRLNQTFVNTVRNSKGNNEYRSLMVPTHAASATNAALRGIETSVTGANGRTMPPTASAFVMPSDPSPATNNRLIMSVHTYSPYDFAFRQRDSQGNVIGLGTTNWSTSGSSAAGPERIDFYFANIQARANELGVPVILGEWGTENKDNTSARVTHATYYVTQARQRGWPTFWWDNNRLDDANSERFALFNPSNNSWRFDTLRAAIIAAATPNPTPVSVTVNSLATTVPQGGTLQFTAQVAPSSASQAVAWTINPSVNGVSISSTGLLTVGSSVPVNQQITVRATAVGHNTVFGTRQVTVSGITATGVTVTAADDAETVLQGGTLAFSASVIPVNAPQTVTWSINPAVNGAAISTTGVLTVGSSVAVGTDITIRATASTGTNVFGQSIVTVTSGTINPTGVTVSAAGGATTVTRGGTLAFSAVVAPEGAPQAVTWSLVSAVNGASIDANTGVLTVTTAANAGAQINVRATVVGHTSITDTMTVTVSDIVPTGVTVSAAGGATTVTRGSTLAF
ncbi:MAG: cellulase family glycosylhydrolase, partial [Defluviitaleaceae bacterium]|nr:cellulase family glycosylhydrolase [Defluviitaleaceae bacterium]